MCLFKSSLEKTPYPKSMDKEKPFTDLNALRWSFYFKYDVNDKAWLSEYIQLKIDPNIPNSSSSINDVITFQPKYAKVCVLAHEICHSVYSRLTQEQVQRFKDTLVNLVPQSKLMELAIKDYNNAKDWATVPFCEMHGQLYRFWGREMPQELHEFYPYLI